MNNYLEYIKEKSNEELLNILKFSELYQPAFIKLVKKELREKRGVVNALLNYDFLPDMSTWDIENHFRENTDFQFVFKNAYAEKILLKDNVPIQTEPKIEKVKEKRELLPLFLVLFILVLFSSGYITVVSGFSNMSLSDYDLGVKGLSVVGLICDIVFILGMSGLSIYVATRFIARKNNAVPLAKILLVVGFVTRLLLLISDQTEKSGHFSSNRMIIILVLSALWFLYLSYSKKVNFIFPKEERKLLKNDKIYLASTIVPGLLWIGLSFIISLNQEFVPAGNYQIAEIITESQLGSNEYTDGRIIFERPYGFSIEKKKVNGDDDLFNLEAGEEVSLMVYSVYDNNDNKEYFNEVMQDFADSTMSNFEYVIGNDKHYILSGNSFYIRELIYRTEPAIKWTFVLIFNKETSKCCVVSCFDSAIGKRADYLESLINSIRFKEK